ncbi:hypothetical protein AHF37_06322 [Paragonimus kellicotti]|nr:hypothetical protein AHF37_06322 [Paragonimus kellicotti]
MKHFDLCFLASISLTMQAQYIAFRRLCLSLGRLSAVGTRKVSVEKMMFPGHITNFTNKLELKKPEDNQAIPIYRVLDKEGVPVGEDVEPQLEKDYVLKAFRTMVLLNTMDRIMYESQRQGRISFYMTNYGEEACHIGSASALDKASISLTMQAQYIAFRRLCLSLGRLSAVGTRKVSVEKMMFPGHITNFTNKLELKKPEDNQAIPIYRVLDKEGVPVGEDVEPQLEKDYVLKAFRTMVLLNTMDRIMYESQRQGRISFYMTNYGEEACHIGSASALDKGKYQHRFGAFVLPYILEN